MNLFDIYLMSIPITAILTLMFYRWETDSDITIRDVLVAIILGAIPIINVLMVVALMEHGSRRTGWLHRFLDKKLF